MNEAVFRVEQIDHVEIFVPDRAAAADWYARVLGLRIIAEHADWAHDPQGPLMVGGGGAMLAFFTGMPQQEAPVAGICRVAFRTDGAGFLQFVQHVLAVNETGVRRIVDHDKAFSCYFTDPWGTPLEVTTYHADVVRAVISP